MTGISTHALRMWERRYGLAPGRTKAGARMYSDEDVERLKLIRALADRGHGIRELIDLEPAQLTQILALHGLPAEPTDAEAIAARLVAACLSLDLAAADDLCALLSESADPVFALREILAPALDEICARWEAGELPALAERAFTLRAATLLGTLSRKVQSPDRPALIAALPSSEVHEFGALQMVTIAVVRGWNALYFGPHLSAADVSMAVRSAKADAVALSILSEHASVPEFLRELRRLVPSGVHVIASGRACGEYCARLPGVRIAPNAEALSDALEEGSEPGLERDETPEGANCPLQPK